MKKYMAIMFLLLVIAGCGNKEGKEKVIENNGMLEIREDMPVKATYLRRWIYGADAESEDQELILELIQKLNNIKLGGATQMSIMDYTDIIIFEYSDGEKVTYEFEGDIYVRSKDDRCVVTEGLKELRSLLDLMLE